MIILLGFHEHKAGALYLFLEFYYYWAVGFKNILGCLKEEVVKRYLYSLYNGLAFHQDQILIKAFIKILFIIIYNYFIIIISI